MNISAREIACDSFGGSVCCIEKTTSVVQFQQRFYSV